MQMSAAKRRLSQVERSSQDASDVIRLTRSKATVWTVDHVAPLKFLAPLKLRLYSAIHICLLLLFFDPSTQFTGNEKITLCNTKKYKHQAGITPPRPSQNSHAVGWHCTAESKRRVAEIKS